MQIIYLLRLAFKRITYCSATLPVTALAWATSSALSVLSTDGFKSLDLFHMKKEDQVQTITYLYISEKVDFSDSVYPVQVKGSLRSESLSSIFSITNVSSNVSCYEKNRGVYVKTRLETQLNRDANSKHPGRSNTKDMIRR